MSAEAFINVLEQDLRLLSSEARKSDGFTSQITGLFHHSDAPNIKDLVEKTLQRLRQHQRDRTPLQVVKYDKVRALTHKLDARTGLVHCT